MTRSLALVNDPAAPRSVVGEIDVRSCDFKRKMKKVIHIAHSLVSA